MFLNHISESSSYFFCKYTVSFNDRSLNLNKLTMCNVKPHKYHITDINTLYCCLTSKILLEKALFDSYFLSLSLLVSAFII